MFGMDVEESHLVELEQGVVTTLTLNRPRRHNSLVPELLQSLCSALEAIGRDPDVRAVVLRANGASFSTGGDVAAFHDQGREKVAAYAHNLVGLLNQSMLTMMALPVPVVCACHGLVTGGSLGLLLASDLVLVSPKVRIQPYYPVVGFSPDGGWTAILPGLVGRARVMDVLATNRPIRARDCVEWGIASRMVDGNIRQEAAQLAAEIARQIPGSISRTIKLLPDQQAIAAGLEDERTAFVEQIQTEEAWLGMARFLGR
ncbi:MAG: enoyl-CoA hydratase/isomerase family protein [Xanthomonadales bacterium]|nr:enoyl-CoA hydratase/isomerase family protein [Xanthomonadales bacterium]